MNYILVRLRGGVGNQLFQYAASYELAKKNGLKLYVDVSSYKYEQLRNFELTQLGITDSIIFTKFQRRILILSKIVIHLILPFFYHEKKLNFDSKLGDLRGDIILDGYFQSLDYFMKSNEEIKIKLSKGLDLIGTNREICNKINNVESVAIHIRRGDYLSEKNYNIFGTCSDSYYKEAIDYFIYKIEKPIFFIFTDDPLWVKENFDLSYVQYDFISDNNKQGSSLLDLAYMAQCKYFIIANSSFSWWGAFLSLHFNKEIIAPKQWFRDPALQSQTINLIPKDWIRI
jgi:hypothetical protein